MSGAYVLQAQQGEDLHHHAHLLSAQMAFGHENVNHYAVSQSVLLGVVSPDPSGQGTMPRYLKEEELWGVLLGRLYNSDFLSAWRRENTEAATDLDVFARLYRNGELLASLPHLNGAFFVILWDPARETLMAANDRFGLHPMYWSRSRERFALASRVLCSVLAGVAPGEWDPVGVAQMLTLNDWLGETTLVRDVAAFPQATMMVKDPDSLSWRRYWQYEYKPCLEVSRKELAEEVGRRLVLSVSRQCYGDGPVGVPLSGGLDSRCLVAAASKAGIPIKTFTWAQPDSVERRFAKNVALLYGAEHHDGEYNYAYLDSNWEDAIRTTDGLCNCLDCHVMMHLDFLYAGPKVLLDGYEGGLFLGGSYLLSAFTKSLDTHRLARKLFSWRNVVLSESDLDQAMPQAITLRECPPSLVLRSLLKGTEHLSTPDRADRFFLENHARRTVTLGPVQTRCAFRTAACFFDYDLIDTILTVPARYRQEHRIYLDMVRTTFPEALSVHWQRTLLPAGAPEWLAVASKAALKGCRILESRLGWPAIASRQATFDFAKCLRGPLRKWIVGICRDAFPSADEVLKPEFCTRVLEQHLAGTDRSRLLGTIAALRGFSRALERARAREPASSQRPTEVRASSER